jgi:hypothetical protein
VPTCPVLVGVQDASVSACSALLSSIPHEFRVVTPMQSPGVHDQVLNPSIEKRHQNLALASGDKHHPDQAEITIE